MENEAEQPKPFVVVGRTMRVLNETPGDWCSVLFKLAKRQVIDSDEAEVEEDLGEELIESEAEEVEEGEEEVVPDGAEAGEGRPRRKRRTRGKGRKGSKHRKQVKKKVKLIKADEEFKLRGGLCLEITSPLILFTLSVRHTVDERGELFYNVVSIDNVECMALPVSFASIKKSICKSHYFGGPNLTPAARGKRIDSAFQIALPNAVAAQETVITPSDAERLSVHTNKEIRFVVNNITRPDCYYQLANKIGSKTVRAMNREEVIYFSGLSAAAGQQQNEGAPVNELEFFERLCFSVELTDENANFFISNATSKKQIRGYEKLLAASRIYHELADNRKKFMVTKLVERTIDLWDKGALKILRAHKSDLVFVGKDNGKYYVQLMEDYNRERLLADTIYGIKDLTVMDFEVDDTDKTAGSFGVCLRRVIQDKRNQDKWMIICSLPRRVHLLKQITSNPLVITIEEALNYTDKKHSIKNRIKRAADPFDVVDKGATRRNILIDRAHLLSTEELQKIISKFSGSLGRLVLCGASQYTPSHPGAWFNSLCKSEYALNEQIKQANPHELVFPSERISGYVPNENTVLNNIPKDKKVNIMVSSARSMRIMQEILNLYASKSLIRVQYIWSLDYKADPADYTVVSVDGATRPSLVKAMQCSSYDKKSICIIGNEESLRKAADTLRTPGLNNLDVLLRKKLDNDELPDQFSDYESQEEDEPLEEAGDDEMLQERYGFANEEEKRQVVYEQPSQGSEEEEDEEEEEEDEEIVPNGQKDSLMEVSGLDSNAPVLNSSPEAEPIVPDPEEEEEEDEEIVPDSL